MIWQTFGPLFLMGSVPLLSGMNVQNLWLGFFFCLPKTKGRNPADVWNCESMYDPQNPVYKDKVVGNTASYLHAFIFMPSYLRTSTIKRMRPYIRPYWQFSLRIFSICSQVGLVPNESLFYGDSNVVGHFRRNDAILLVMYIFLVAEKNRRDVLR